MNLRDLFRLVRARAVFLSLERHILGSLNNTVLATDPILFVREWGVGSHPFDRLRSHFRKRCVER